MATVGYSSSGLTHVRGVLQEEYSVKPEEIEWISTQKDSGANLTGGVSNWEKIRSKEVKITDAPEGEDESTLLISGKVDAILHPAEPKVYQDCNPLVERLFKDHRSVEQDLAAADLGEIDRRLNNPLTFQNNTAINKGYAVENSLSKNFLSRRA